MVAHSLCTLDADFNTYVKDDNEVMQAELFSSASGSTTEDTGYPLSAHRIAQEQANDKQLALLLKNNPKYFTKAVEKVNLVYFKGKIYIPASLRPEIIQWYHDMLCHPGQTRMEMTIRQHMVWPGLTADMKNHCAKCRTCQQYKNRSTKYGKLPVKITDIHLWHTVSVDLVGPISFTSKDGKDFSLLVMIMADPATGWFKIHEIPNKGADMTSRKFDHEWLCRYPRLVECIYNNGNEFLGREFGEMLDSYNIKKSLTMVKNSQANFVK